MSNGQQSNIISDYVNTRGGRVALRALHAPEVVIHMCTFNGILIFIIFWIDWKSAKNAVESALQLEKGKQGKHHFLFFYQHILYRRQQFSPQTAQGC